MVVTQAAYEAAIDVCRRQQDADASGLITAAFLVAHGADLRELARAFPAMHAAILGYMSNPPARLIATQRPQRAPRPAR